MNEKIILDACCGGRMFWFNKTHPNVLYVDKRVAEKGHVPQRPNHEVKPDKIMDFRNLEFSDCSFKLVVFDPPHLKQLSETSIMGKKYGVLNNQTWPYDIGKGFEECWRVLEDYGVLIFKWNEARISLEDVLKVIKQEPLFGHTTNKMKTHWLCFMKIPKGEARQRTVEEASA